MPNDDEDRWEERCPYCPHYLAEHTDSGCAGFNPESYDTICPCLEPGR